MYLNTDGPKYIYVTFLVYFSRYVLVGIESWAAVNGAHINPCVTVLFIFTKRISFIKGR